MTFFYDLNKRLAAITDKPETKQLNEGAQSAVAEGSTGDYSAKKARAGKDIGKPGKNFEKIAKSAGERYGSKAAGERVAGAVLAKLRGKNESTEVPPHREKGPKPSEVPAVMRKSKGRTPLSLQDLEKEQQRALGHPETLKRLAKQVSNEADMEEGNAFTAALAKTPKGGKFKVGDKTFIDRSDYDGKSVDEGWEDMMKDVEARAKKPRVGDIERGHKHDIEHTATGRKVTRRVDDQGHSVGADDDTEAQPEKRGRGRPKKTDKKPERVTAKAYKHKGGRRTDEDYDKDEYDEEGEMAKSFARTIEDAAEELQSIIGDNENLPEWVQKKIILAYDYLDTARDYLKANRPEQEMDESALQAYLGKKKYGETGMKALQKAGREGASKETMAKIRAKHDKMDEEALDEKAVSVSQRRAAGIAHAAQKGEIPKSELRGASKEMAKMPKDELAKFAKTKEKGLPKKKTEESSAEDSAPKSKGGLQFGKGIYDSINREVEAIIAESMNISMNMNSDEHGGPSKSLTVTATDDDAAKLASLLKMAGVGNDSATDAHEEPCADCGMSDCECDHTELDEVDQNQPDYPTNTETSSDALQYSGGVDGPKSTGQTTVPVIASQTDRQHTYEGDDLTRIRDLAGIQEAAKPDYIDLDKDGDKEESMKKAAADKEKEDKKVDESILSMTNLWKAYKG